MRILADIQISNVQLAVAIDSAGQDHALEKKFQYRL
jgi:hypothetical protein